MEGTCKNKYFSALQRYAHARGAAESTMSKLGIQTPNTVLVAIMNQPADFLILQQQGWYRIPVSTKMLPEIIRNRSVRYLAIYQTKKFKQGGCTIEWYGEVANITIAPRAALFPHESQRHPKANRMYYKIQVVNLRRLPRPIVSHRPRRILFIPTTEEKFFGAARLEIPEINHLFNDSPLENLLYQRLLDARIFAERQYEHQQRGRRYRLDFAVFCKHKNLNIECDGMTYHYATTEQKLADNERNNHLTSDKWSVLRYPTRQLTNEMDSVMGEIKRTVDEYGGVQDPNDGKHYYYVSDNDQLSLF